jgi:dTDP-4-dehydrorhamnose reductase
MNILIFGKDGQLGKAFKAVFDENKPGELHRISYVGRAECDLTNFDAIALLLNQIKPDLIINAAAYTAVDKAETEVDLAYAINAKAPEIMAAYAIRNGATFLHYSTDYVFDGSKKTPYLEDDPRNPLGVYGKSKAAGEEAIEAVFAESSSRSGRYAILRTSWVYGDGGNFIRTILRLAKERETLKVIADQYGVPTSADWLAKISLALVLNEEHQLKPFASGIYHAVPQGETTWHGLACYAVQIAIDSGAVLQLQPDAIEAIPAAEYSLPAPRPRNSIMYSNALYHIFINDTDASKLQLLKCQWSYDVVAYIQSLTIEKTL